MWLINSSFGNNFLLCLTVGYEHYGYISIKSEFRGGKEVCGNLTGGQLE